MFTETEGGRKTIGDVDVVFHEGLYHLFHLVLPNHDFIAHAVSTDGINWRRVKNALFIADPGSWDDLMLWTMHVTRDPHQPGGWRMFYTGLSRRDHGKFQRIGMAVSEDLYHWKKAPVNWNDARGPRDPESVQHARRLSEPREADRFSAMFDAESCFPLEPDPAHYEVTLDGDRGLVSFRDPYFVHDGETGWLLAAARVNTGPLSRRGCVAVYEETAAGRFEPRPPLHHPRMYDDVEVPNILKIDGLYYLIGSIREDAKIRYWYADHVGGCWRSFHDNVLMAQGNYAGRICQDDQGWLLWNFFSMDREDRTANNLMPPPKRLFRTEEGLLRAKTYEGFEDWFESDAAIDGVQCLFADCDHDRCQIDGQNLELQSECGFQAFVFPGEFDSFRFRGTLELQGKGKCGMVFRLHPDTHDGYYLSFDLLKGVAQLRSWGTGPEGSGEDLMRFRSLQSGFWYTKTPGRADVDVLAFGSYLEVSIDGRIVLSLANQDFQDGKLGIYLDTAHLKVTDVRLQNLHSPTQSDQHLFS